MHLSKTSRKSKRFPAELRVLRFAQKRLFGYELGYI